jgi:hypothetical protein
MTGANCKTHYLVQGNPGDHEFTSKLERITGKHTHSLYQKDFEVIWKFKKNQDL